MRGRWAAGIVPRNFCWVIKDHLAVSERPGGYAPNHRKVRRQEELLWLRAQGFTRVVSLLGSTHNLHAYEELGLEWSRFAMPAPSETRVVLAKLYPALHGWLRGGERLLLHQEELGDCVMGVAAGYLLWSEILPDGPRAITAMEQLLRRQMGTVGRMIVAAVDEVPPVRNLGLVSPPDALETAAREVSELAETIALELAVFESGPASDPGVLAEPEPEPEPETEPETEADTEPAQAAALGEPTGEADPGEAVHEPDIADDRHEDAGDVAQPASPGDEGLAAELS
jgi:hypothetical protein